MERSTVQSCLAAPVFPRKSLSRSAQIQTFVWLQISAISAMSARTDHESLCHTKLAQRFAVCPQHTSVLLYPSLLDLAGLAPGLSFGGIIVRTKACAVPDVGDGISRRLGRVPRQAALAAERACRPGKRSREGSEGWDPSLAFFGRTPQSRSLTRLVRILPPLRPDQLRQKMPIDAFRELGLPEPRSLFRRKFAFQNEVEIEGDPGREDDGMTRAFDRTQVHGRE
jgi:hypothetical protein